MRILVTGSHGKIGRWVVQRLHQAGHILSTLNLSSAGQPSYGEHTAGDVRDLALVRRLMQGMDAVVHLAAIPHDLPGREDEVLEINLRGTWNILLAAAEAGVRRVVYFSSINALGQGEPTHQTLYLPLDDEIPHQPVRTYSLSKHLCEQMCTAFAGRGAYSVISLRPTLVTQPGPPEDRWWLLLPADWIERSQRNDFYSYVDVRDVAEAALLSLSAPVQGHRAFLLTADDNRTHTPTAEIVARFYPHLPWKKTSLEAWLARNPYRTLVDCSAAKQALGWQPRFSMFDPSAGYDDPEAPAPRGQGGK